MSVLNLPGDARTLVGLLLSLINLQLSQLRASYTRAIYCRQYITQCKEPNNILLTILLLACASASFLCLKLHI